MKTAGIILLVLQAVSLFAAIVSGDNIFANGLANLIGRQSFGIVGAVLLIIYYKKQNKK